MTVKEMVFNKHRLEFQSVDRIKIYNRLKYNINLCTSPYNLIGCERIAPILVNCIKPVSPTVLCLCNTSHCEKRELNQGHSYLQKTKHDEIQSQLKLSRSLNETMKNYYAGLNAFSIQSTPLSLMCFNPCSH